MALFIRNIIKDLTRSYSLLLWRVSLLLVFTVAIFPITGAPLSDSSFIESGDRYYKKAQYDYALVSYEEALKLNEKLGTKEKLALSQMRLNDFHSAQDTLLTESRSFDGIYLRMFARLREGDGNSALKDHSLIAHLPDLSFDQADYSDLLIGSLYIENHQYEAAREHYKSIQKSTENNEIRKTASSILYEMDMRERVGRKYPWLAGVFSAILPGSGQIYASHEADGITAFLINAVFLTAAGTLYNHEHALGQTHEVSGAFALVGSFFYTANVVGAFASAKRYNIYQDRVFHEKLRRTYFNIDFVEKSANIRFSFSLSD